MSQTLFIRTPFQPVDGSTASDYTLFDEFATTGQLTVQVNSTDLARRVLQPVFGGLLTFKPSSVPPDDPTAAASTVTGDLFLELSTSGRTELAAANPQFAHTPMFVYFNVTLDSRFFTQTVVDPLRLPGGGFKIVKEIIDNKEVVLRTAAKIASAFARGVISIEIFPGRASPNSVFPTLAVDPILSVAIARFRLGIRPHRVPSANLTPLIKLSGAEILASPGFVPVPIVFFYRMLSHLPTWQTLAADGHAAHPFVAALKASEAPAGSPPAPAVRWRQLRVFLPGPRSATPLPHPAREGVTVTARPAAGAGDDPLWSVPLSSLGEVFVDRPDNEQYRVQLRDLDGSVIKLVRDRDNEDVDELGFGWDPPDGDAEPPGRDITARVPMIGDPLALPFRAIPFGAYDKDGMTVIGSAPNLQLVAGRAVVAELKTLMRVLGFRIVREGSVFDLALSWGLRELQIYAAMSRVATEDVGTGNYADRLIAVDNPAIYTGVVDGTFSEATAAVLRTWRARVLRCPVVVESWTVDADRRRVAIVNENLWTPEEDQDRDHFVHVLDLTGHYSIPIFHLDAGRVLIGSYKARGVHQGMVCDLEHHTTWTPDSDITPLRLIGRVLANPVDARDRPAASTYKVIAAVSLAETGRVFDALNGWDRAVMSLGLCQWTVFLAEGAAELPAYLALLRTAAPTEYEQLFGRFGIQPEGAWPPLGSDGEASNPLFFAAERKWATRLQQRGLRNGDAIDPGLRRLTNIEDANYLRNWHWFYRWVMAARTGASVQTRQWYLARLRLRAIRSALWSQPGFPATTTIGDVFSSERMVAALLRAHVKGPGYVVVGGHASPKLHTAYVQANLSSSDPGTWTQADMNKLQASLEATLGAVVPDLSTATTCVDPVLGALDTSRGSFSFDTTDLPTPP